MTEMKIIDWELGAKLANNQIETARELFELLIEKLPEEFAEMKKSKAADDYTELLRQVHKLHGAVCYCGVPRLKHSLLTLEAALKKNKVITHEIDGLFSVVENEVTNVLKESGAK